MYADIIGALDIKTKYDDIKAMSIDSESQLCIESNDGSKEQLFPITETLFRSEFNDIVELVVERIDIIAGVPRIYDQLINDLVIKTPINQVRQIFIDDWTVKLRLKDDSTEALFDFTELFTPMHWRYVILQIRRKLTHSSSQSE